MLEEIAAKELRGLLLFLLDPNGAEKPLRTLAGTPAVFRELLQAHMGHRKLASVLLRRGPLFGVQLIT